MLATGSRSRKVANLARDGRASLTLHDSRPGAEVCGACLVGRAEVVAGEEARRSIDLVHRRYVDDAGLALPPVRDFLGSDDAAHSVPAGAGVHLGRAAAARPPACSPSRARRTRSSRPPRGDMALPVEKHLQ